MRHLLIRDLLSQLSSKSGVTVQSSGDYLEWINSNLVNFTDEFVRKNGLSGSRFIKGMNKTFKTTRFELLLKRWIVEYLEKGFKLLGDRDELTLEDNLVNRFLVEKYSSNFATLPKIEWKEQPALLPKLYSILVRCAVVTRLSLNNGIKVSGRRKKYKVMREAVWGLYAAGGYYFHDDFMVDGDKIKKEDLLLFSRGIPVEPGRLKGYQDARRSPYAHFNLMSLSVGLDTLLLRIIPKYIFLSHRLLFEQLSSDHFTIFYSIYMYFLYNALPYEKVFSHFEVMSEFAHNYFAAGHIPEAIICKNYGTKYYFLMWSDMAAKINEYTASYLGCDGYLLWGKAHITGLEGDSRIFMLTGFPFKRFIKEVRSNRNKVLSDMGISAKGKITTFFDESFGGECQMTEENFVTFWETAFQLSQIEEGNTILIKPKGLVGNYHNLSDGSKKRFIDIKTKIEKRPNIYIVDGSKWSFIECIGVSDIVVTQGMTTSSTIAIICGIEGLYLNEAQYDHPFSRLFKDRIVFDDRRKLLAIISKIIEGSESPLKDIPENILRDFDAYDDDMGIDRFRDVLCETKKQGFTNKSSPSLQLN